MIEVGTVFLVVSNVVLLASAASAICTGYGWKQAAQRKSSIIENYERELSELRYKNRRLSEAVDALSREDE